jgi:hypothetical protein
LIGYVSHYTRTLEGGLRERGLDKFTLGLDKYTLGEDKVSQGLDKKTLGLDKVSQCLDKVSQGLDKNTLGEDRYTLGTAASVSKSDKKSRSQAGGANSAGTWDMTAAQKALTVRKYCRENEKALPVTAGAVRVLWQTITGKGVNGNWAEQILLALESPSGSGSGSGSSVGEKRVITSM